MDINIPFALTFLLNMLFVILALAALTLPIFLLWRGIRNQRRAQLETQKVFADLLAEQRETNRLLSALVDGGRQDRGCLMRSRTGWAPRLAGVWLVVVTLACVAPPSIEPTLAPAPTVTDQPPTATLTSTRTARPTRAPTFTPTLTPSPTPVATAETPPQLELELPEGFSLEAYELAALPIPGEPFQPVAASAEAVLERHRSHRELEWPYLYGTVADPEAYYTVQAIGATDGEIFYARSVAVESADRGMLEGIDVIRADQVLFSIPPEPMGPGLLGRLWVDGPHWYLNVMHARSIPGTEVELIADVIADGQSLSQQLGFDEAFNFQLLADRPFFFYRDGDSYGFSYDGVLYSTGFTSIEHNLCCAGGILNPLAAKDMVAFYARRGENWYYVEAGVFPVSGAATAEPDVESAPKLYPQASPRLGQGAWVNGQLCPSLNGVLQPTALHAETALAVVQRFASGDAQTARAATDPASASPHADLLRGGQ